MSRFHRPTGAAVAVSAFAAAATFLTLTSWAGLSEAARDYLVPLFWLVGLVAVAGLLLRAATVVAPLVLAGQLLLLLVVLTRMWAPADALLGWLPTPASLVGVGDTLARAVEASSEYPAPVPADVPEFAPLLILAGVAVALLVDFLAATMRAVPLAGLPLLAAFTAPVSLLDGVSWLTFALAAGCFVLLLAADQSSRLSRWGRSFSPASATSGTNGVVDSQPHSVGLGTIFPSAARIGAVGVGLAVLAPVVLPAGTGLFDGDGPGSGDGDGDGVSITNPMVDVKRDLTVGPDEPLVVVQTDDPDPRYLRLTVLDEFTGLVWKPQDRVIPETQRADGAFPPAPGLSGGTPRTEYSASVSVTEAFESTWLPLPYPATSAEAPGDWRYDLDTLDLIRRDPGLTSAGLEYSYTALDVEPRPEDLVQAGPAPRRIAFANTDLPSSTPPWITDLAQEVTAGADSTFERAVMLQDWFREDGGFQYSLDRGSGSSLNQLELFLGTGPGSRTGYCEQFASAMAMMARSLGIPARVAVGFLRPDPAGPDRWVYSTRDMHAWPEIYLHGAGWVRFEPTPGDRAEAVPSYTSGRIPDPQDLATPSATPSEELPSPPVPEQPTDQAPTTAASDGFPWGRTALGVLGVLVLAGLVVGPRLARASVRRRRLTEGSPGDRVEGAWAEVRATALDLGLGWDDGVTLRQRARALLPSVKAAPEAVRSLERLVLLLEQARYSRGGVAEEAAEAAEQHLGEVTDAMSQSVTRRTRRGATWLPVSLWRGRRIHSVRMRSESGAGARRQTEADSVSL